MRDIVVVGAAETKFGKLESSFRDIAVEAANAAMADAGIDRQQIEAMYLGTFSPGTFIHQEHPAPLVASMLGLAHVPTTRTENACASGSSAFLQGLMAIGSGMYDTVLVVGAEKMTSTPIEETTQILAEAADWESETLAGATFPSLFALMARRHMHEFGTTRAHLSAVAIKNHHNAFRNPYAQFHREITEADINNSAMIADPLTLYDCSPVTDGAAAVVISTRERARNLAGQPVKVLGFGQASDSLSLFRREDMTCLVSARKASERAYKMAGIGPSDVSFAEVHDCFTIAEIVATEDLGFFDRGQGGPAALAGETALNGRIPVNPSGGLKGKGHPVGATGVSQVVESVFQLRGTAGERQVASRDIGLTHNVGGSGATCVVTILGQAA
ncbi:MAG TPA: thiolase domain-containing protein [Chloroflexota bacterium]|nr:thiolase domain-containing protein [Chloroflexota bacterium]